jgi:hypothetical protein
MVQSIEYFRKKLLYAAVEARADVEAAAVELKALRASSTGSSVSADDDRDNELKLRREAAREQAARWAAAHPQGRRVPDGGGSPDRRNTLPSLSGIVNPGSLTSMWWTHQPFWAASARRSRTDSIRATGAKASSKSIPSRCKKPRATKRALCLMMAPTSSLFSLNTHLRVIAR